jgi:hypothetical protein
VLYLDKDLFMVLLTVKLSKKRSRIDNNSTMSRHQNLYSRYSKITESKRSQIDSKQQKQNINKFVKLHYHEFIKRFEEDWLSALSLCKPLYVEEKDLGFFDKYLLPGKFSDLKMKEGVQILKKNGYQRIVEDFTIPHGLLFPIYKFDLKQFIQEERKFVLIIKEVQLLNLIGSIVNGLSLCRSMKLPHGNLSLTTIFKKGKYDWEISPPLYSRINLTERRTQESDYVNIAISGQFATDYLIAPEMYEFLDQKAKCKVFKELIASD